jgi:2-methylcitrate dehydratase PrpD
VIDASIALATEHNLTSRDIRSVRVLMPEAAINTVCEPKERKRAPDDTYGAQFSVYFAAACGIVRRRFTLKDVETESLADPEIRALCAKVDYAIDPNTNFPRHYSAEVVITLNDGRELRRREDVNRGSADRPLEAEAIERKFLDNAQRVTSRAHGEALLEAILSIERASDVSSITSKLSLPA